MHKYGGMLVGRHQETARLDRLIQAAGQGRSEVLVLRGEPGVGKTALLRYAVGRATEAGLRTVQARGIESESELPFAGLADLLRPIRQASGLIPQNQQAVLAGALATGPPVPSDRFAVCVAALSLLAASAEDRPLLAVVDDIQWLDASSVEAVLFAARRLEAEGIAMLIALREGEQRSIDVRDFPSIPLTGLDVAAAVRLLTTSDPTVAPAVAARLNVAVGGNPLALLEIPSLLSEHQRAGIEPLPDPLPAGPHVERAFLRRVRALPVPAQRALVVAAASDSSDFTPIRRAVELMSLPTESLQAAESAGLITRDAAHLRFGHPLIRSAIYQAADPGDRRSAHAALAEALEGEDQADRRAWHLAWASTGPDESVASALEQTAERSRLRSGYGAAASALIRAAGLTPSSNDRARRLLNAANALQLAGKPNEALTLLDEFAGDSPNDEVRSEIEQLRARIETWVASPMTAHRRFLAEASRCEVTKPFVAAMLLAEAALACTMAGEISVALNLCKRAQALGRRQGSQGPFLVKVVLANTLMLAGRSHDASALLDEVLADIANVGPAEARQIQFLLTATLTALERFGDARRLVLGALSASREASAVAVLPLGLAVLTDLEFRSGNMAGAYASGTESIRLARETGQGGGMAYCLAMLARVEAAQGRDSECRAHVAAAVEIARERGTLSILHFAHAALGLLELGRGRLLEAREHLDEVARLAEEHGLREPNQVQALPDHIEVLARMGQRDAAKRAVESLDRYARAGERFWAMAAVARYLGYLADGDFAKHFEDALELHRSSPSKSAFEVARTQLCYGEALRRNRDRVSSREHLRAALQAFEQMGAEPWAHRARAELSATGERARKRNLVSSRNLTAQELQIALAVADGATNREVAAQLFLSPKTVESHLSSLYRKLEIRSRTDLARLFASRASRTARPTLRSNETLIPAFVACLAEYLQQLQDGFLFGAWSAPGA